MSYRNHTREDGPKQVGPGWKDLVLECFDICDAVGIPYQVVQIKEKFAGLRFYVYWGSRPGQPDNLTDDEIEKVQNVWKQLADVERRSYTICEDCGQPGEQSTNRHYLLTLCETHRKRINPWTGEPEVWRTISEDMYG